MIDENLCRAELSPIDRAKQTARRKAIYLELHPETGHGGDRKSDQVDNLSTRSFATETASLIGKDERSVRRDVERGEKVIGCGPKMKKAGALAGLLLPPPVHPRSAEASAINMAAPCG